MHPILKQNGPWCVSIIILLQKLLKDKFQSSSNWLSLDDMGLWDFVFPAAILHFCQHLTDLIQT